MNKEPVRIIEGNAQPYARFWSLRAAEDSESGEPEIEFYGPISEYSWYGDEITPILFKEDLEKHGKGGPVTIRIHSPGGDVFAASAIRAMIADYPGKVTTRIDGLCASAATYVAMAGDHVVMQDSAFFMIHDPWTVTIGGVEELKTTISFLKTVKDGIVETYQNKTHLDAEELARMMSNETWMTARQAQEKGFVDEVVSVTDAKPFKLQLQNMAVLNCLQSYEKVPEELINNLKVPAPSLHEVAESSHCENDSARPEELINNLKVPAPSLRDGEESCEDPDQVEEVSSEADETVTETAEVDGDEVEKVPQCEDPDQVEASDQEAVEEIAEVDQADAAEERVDEARELRDYLDIFGPKE